MSSKGALLITKPNKIREHLDVVDVRNPKDRQNWTYLRKTKKTEHTSAWTVKLLCLEKYESYIKTVSTVRTVADKQCYGLLRARGEQRCIIKAVSAGALETLLRSLRFFVLSVVLPITKTNSLLSGI